LKYVSHCSGTLPLKQVEAMVYTEEEVVLERCEKFISETYWTDINIHSQMYPQRHPIDAIQCLRFDAARPHYSFDQLKHIWDSSDANTIEECRVGSAYGPSWSTVWFRLEYKLPSSFVGEFIGLRWDSSSEAFAYSEQGEYLQSFTGSNGADHREIYQFPSDCSLAHASSPSVIYIEMACNGMFGNGNNGMIKPPDPNRTFTLNKAEIVTISPHIVKLYWQLTNMHSIATNTKDPSVRAVIVTTINYILNTITIADESSVFNCIEYATHYVFNNQSKLHHTVTAIGHCHIDTAWLWTYKESHRKIMRSWATQLHLLSTYPDWKFTASQTVQYEWLQKDHPALFNQIKAHVSQGRFIPIGSTYVEFDANIPSCESMIRQFLYGGLYFKKEFGVTSDVFWLPDTFGM
jgi:alpha-mannosidase